MWLVDLSALKVEYVNEIRMDNEIYHLRQVSYQFYCAVNGNVYLLRKHLIGLL